MSKSERSIQSSFLHLQQFSGTETIKLLSFLHEFMYVCDSLGYTKPLQSETWPIYLRK